MECLHCKGHMRRSVAPFSVDRQGYHIVWEAVPAWVCTQCNEPCFESPEVDMIQRALAAIDRETAGLAPTSSVR
jgi:YgiT-type zinc finger domain-containing protein